LDSEAAELAADGLQDEFVARGRRRSDLVARPEPIRAGLLYRERGWLHIGAGNYLALDLCKSLPGFLFGPVAAA
jgi:hypothetical protein